MKSNRLLIVILLFGGLLRVGASIWLGDSLEGTQQHRIHDQISYNALAMSLVKGQGYSFESYWYPFTPAQTPTAHWSFLYPAYLAGVYALFGYHPVAARLIQAALCGVLSIWLSYRMGKRLFGDNAGLLAAALFSVYAYFIFHDAALMTEAFFTVGVLAMLNLSLDIVEKLKQYEKGGLLSPGLWWWLGLGAVLGVTAVLRQTILLWTPFLILWILWAGRGKVRLAGPALAVGIAALLILPWTIRNYIVYDAFLPLNSNAGYALYSANHPNHGTQFDQDYAAPLPEDLVKQGLNEAQWNTQLTKRGLQFILEDPGRYLQLTLDRFRIFFDFWFRPESSLISNLMRVLSFGLYLPFFIAGLIFSLRAWRSASIIYLFILVFSAIHILTWASVRYRLPVDAALMPFAALAVSSCWSWIKRQIALRPLHQEIQPH
jgi:4-amino-4-deoxy-L-arabinose transferase-like glycosyltransferase